VPPGSAGERAQGWLWHKLATLLWAGAPGSGRRRARRARRLRRRSSSRSAPPLGADR